MRMLLSCLTLNDISISDVFERATNHDERAALVCLLTAMFAAKGDAVIVGDDHGGWFWLPPMELWAGWAQDSLKLALSKHQRGGFPNTARWALAIPEISQ
jgi:hypothetical protein